MFTRRRKSVVQAPVAGAVVALGDVPDPVFASGTVGAGCAIAPADGRFTSPIDGEIMLVAPTGHAFAVRGSDGVEVLVHIGIDTVALKGVGFDVRKQAGDRVAAGELVVVADLDLLRAKAPTLVSPVLVCNAAKHPITSVATGNVQQGDPLITLDN